MEDTVSEVLQRWEPTGLIYGLPSWEKEELAQLYDNATRLLLASETSGIPKDVYETLSDVTIPTVRRLYRRVGVNFDMETMMGKLLIEVSNNHKDITKEVTDEVNPIVAFCVEFADRYEDDITDKKQFTKEQYVERVDKLLDTLKTVLLSNEMVSFVDRTGSDWKVVYSDTKKSSNQVRMWNQKRGIETLHAILNDTNQGI